MKTSQNISPTTEPVVARKITLSGKVQGVGFRPFIFRLAGLHQLSGWVRNCVGRVEVHAEGPSQNIDDFIRDIALKKPPLAEPVIDFNVEVECGHYDDFTILESTTKGEAHITLPADLNLCDECLDELNDPTNRRYRYPFINCTQCGPRYTLITQLPYDRINTTMAGFPLCDACKSEYEDPANRRFHAEPVACPDCGPSLHFHQGDSVCHDNETALTQTVEALRRGEIVAVKGIGGYHLMCDASSDAAIQKLRNRKARPDKPLAVMFPSTPSYPFAQVEKQLPLNDSEKTFLLQPSRPILLLEKGPHITLSSKIAAGLNEVGIMLPYSPLHHLLLNDFAAPLIATSANISGEPVLTDEQEIEKRLTAIADAFLHHNRPIARPADDPVYRTIAGKTRTIRSGRGAAPMEVTLPFSIMQPVLAVGTQMKNTITLAWGNRAVISPHIGEMHSARTLKVFEETIRDLQELYEVKAQQIICDAHPDYTATRWANRQGLPVTPVLHHHAHASAAYHECDTDEAVMAFTWDGVGLGDDDTLWGGETFIGKPGQWQRVASFRPFSLPGGDKAGRQPWRSAAALCWEVGQVFTAIPEKDPLLKQAWEQGINSPQTHSVGRLFDAAAALTDTCTVASFEGQGAMLLEALSDKQGEPVELPLTQTQGVLQTDWQPLLPLLLDSSQSVQQRATRFHASLSHALLQQAIALREKSGVNIITLSGGVFQNRILGEQALSLLSANDFVVHYPELIPVNDAGISFGQIVEYGYRQNESN